MGATTSSFAYASVLALPPLFPHPLVCDAAAAAAARLLPVFLNECQRAAARVERGAVLL
jgi:hypothetical protein